MGRIAKSPQERQEMPYTVHEKAGDYFLLGNAEAGGFGVLLTHGFTGSTFDLREIADYLNAQGWTVLVKRIAGHGTDPRDLARTTPAEWRASMDEGLRQLEQQCQNIAVVGNSFGGSLLVDLAVRHPKTIQAACLLSTPIFTYGEWWKRRLLPLVMPWKFSVKKGWMHYEGKADYLSRGSYIEIPLRTYKYFLDFLHNDSKRQFRELPIPVLLIYSSRDSVVKPHSAEYIYNALPHTQKQLYWVHDSYHSPLRSKKKDEVFRLIVDFLRPFA